MIMRSYLFGTIFLSVLIAKNNEYTLGKVLVMIFLLAAIPLHVAAHYGNEGFDAVYEGEINGIRFVTEKKPEGYFISFYMNSLYDYPNKGMVEHAKGRSLVFQQGFLRAPWLPLNATQYVWINKGDLAYDDIMDLDLMNDFIQNLENSPYYSRMYENEHVIMYVGVYTP